MPTASGLELTTLERVRAELAIPDDDVAKDPILSRLITAVSAEMEAEMRRYTKEKSYVETIPFWPPTRMVQLSGFPVLDTPAPVLLASNQRDFVTGPTTLTRGVDYTLENESGIVRLLITVNGVRDPGSGRVVAPSYLQATYTGGLASKTSDLVARYPSLASAADLQVGYLFKRQSNPASNLTVGSSSSAFQQGAYDWLPSVKRAIDMHKRRGIY